MKNEIKKLGMEIAFGPYKVTLAKNGQVSYFKDGKIHIKILKEDKNNFIYDNFVWNKIKYIKKIDYTGNLYSLSLKSNNFYLTEFGFIS